MKITHLLFATALVVGGTWIGAEEPTPTPTPEYKGEQGLSDVAGEIKLNTAAVSKDGTIVISDKNLSSLAEKGHVTEVTKPGAQHGKRALSDISPEAQLDEQIGGDLAEDADKKAHWQGIYDRQLEQLRAITVQIEQLDYEIPGLWRDFYSWDDPAYRDGVIKPKLDQALAKRQKLENDLQAGKARLDQIKADARKDGGEPGWFRGFEPLPTAKPTQGVMPK